MRRTREKKMKKGNQYGSSGIIATGPNLKNVPVQTTLTIPKSVNCWMPDRLRTTLRWWNSPVLNLSTVTYGNLRYQPSAAFDIDPAVGGTAIVGYNELANIYGSYRVSASRCKIEFCSSALSTPIRVILCPTNLDPGSSPTGPQVVQLVDQPYAVSKLASVRGGPTTRLEQGMSTQKIFGSPMTQYDDNFASLTSTVPNNNWYWVVAWFASATVPLTEGIINLNVMIDIEVEFYDRRRAT